MRPKSIVLLLLALGCGLVASIGINQVLASRREAPQVVKGETQAILVAQSDIGVWEPLTVQKMKLEEWPKELVPANAITKLEEAEGRRARTEMTTGEPILTNKLLSPDASETGSAGLIPKGYRAVSVRVDAVSGGASLILPKDRVDVLVHISSNPGRGMNQTVTRTILQDVQVFAVNDVFRRDPAMSEESSIAASTITLLLTPEDAELVTLASELGKIRLVLRSPEDDEVAEPPGADLAELFKDALRKGERGDESLEVEDEDGDNAGQSLVDMIAAEQAKQPEPAEPEPAAQSEDMWTMLLLVGAEPREVQFRAGSRMPQVSGGPQVATTTPPAVTPPETVLPTGTEPAQPATPEAAPQPQAGDSSDNDYVEAPGDTATGDDGEIDWDQLELEALLK